MSDNGQMDIWLAVGEDGVALLEHTTMHPTAKYPYETIVTFGGCQVKIFTYKGYQNIEVIIYRKCKIDPRF